MRKSIDSIQNLCYTQLAKAQGGEQMFNQNLLKAKLLEKGVSISELCNNLGICEATFYRKMARNGDFSRFEIKKITETLLISDDERDRIFFAQ